MARSLPSKVCPFLVTVDLKLKWPELPAWPELPRPTLFIVEHWAVPTGPLNDFTLSTV